MQETGKKALSEYFGKDARAKMLNVEYNVHYKEMLGTQNIIPWLWVKADYKMNKETLLNYMHNLWHKNIVAVTRTKHQVCVVFILTYY
jgi:hypothetical protein